MDLSKLYKTYGESEKAGNTVSDVEEYPLCSVANRIYSSCDGSKTLVLKVSLYMGSCSQKPVVHRSFRIENFTEIGYYIKEY